MPRQYTPENIVNRFWSKVDTSGDCWMWTASVTRRGYGQLPRGRGQSARANRISWEIHNGPIPDGLDVLHTCDNPGCVRPDHLFLGTKTDNMRDMAAKGRAGRGPIETVYRGEQCWKARLAADEVRAIRDRYRDGGISQQELAAEFGVTFQNIHRIVRRKSWKHID